MKLQLKHLEKEPLVSLSCLIELFPASKRRHTFVRIDPLSRCSQASAVWLSNLLREMTILEAKSKITIMKDNAGCLAFVNDSRVSARTKPIAVRIDFIRDLIKSKVIQVKTCPAVDMLADPPTKPFGAVDLKRKVDALMETANTTDDGDYNDPDTDDHYREQTDSDL